MKTLKIMLKKVALTALAIAFVSLNFPAALATGPETVTGPAEPTGIQEQTGTIGQTGVQTMSNSLTGPDSENSQEVNTDTEVNVDIENDATIDNQVDLDLNTGKNTVGANTVSGNVTTGNIDSDQCFVNMANTDLAPGSSVGCQTVDATGKDSIVLTPDKTRVDLENQLTGPDSKNSNTINQDNEINIIEENNADITNEFDIEANTGLNNILNNTKAGNLTTGDIDLLVNLLNLANLQMPNLLLSADVWNLIGEFSGDIVFDNYLTGPDSENSNQANIENKFNAEIVQNADIDNLIDINTNTGQNTVGENTIVGDITTGNTKVETTLANLANIASIPMFYIFNVYGEWNGEVLGLDPGSYVINFMNDLAGPDSTNSNKYNSTIETNISLENNAYVKNILDINANTGRNNISNNTIAGDIKTGAINVTANVVNVMNSFSEKVGKFALGLVNIFCKPKPVEPCKTCGGSKEEKEVKGSSEKKEVEEEISPEQEVLNVTQLPITGADLTY